MKRLLASVVRITLRGFLFAFYFVPAAALHGQAVIMEPASGSPLRKAILDGLRPEIEKKFGSEIQFVVKTIRVSPQWAFVEAEPRHKDGTPFDTKQIFGGELEQMDGIDVGAILELTGATWHLRDHAIGPTDVWWLSWCDKKPRDVLPGCPQSTNARQAHQPEQPPNSMVGNNAPTKAQESAPQTTVMTGEDSATAASLSPWQSIRDQNAVAVRSLIASVKANPALATSFSACAVHHGDLVVAGITQGAEKIRRESERKSQIQAWDDYLRFQIRNRLIFGEGLCVWKVVAWANGMTTFDPAQFTPDPRLGQIGQALMLEKVGGLECRKAGEPLGEFTATSVSCATNLATQATDMLHNPDLTAKAFERLARLLATDLPPEFTEFSNSAVSQFDFSRLTLTDLLLINAIGVKLR